MSKGGKCGSGSGGGGCASGGGKHGGAKGPGGKPSAIGNLSGKGRDNVPSKKGK